MSFVTRQIAASAPAPQIYRVTRNTGKKVNAWMQGKMARLSTGRIVSGFSQGSAHPATSDQVAYTIYSDDDGVTWSTPVAISVEAGKSSGKFCCAVGVDNNDVLWAIERNQGSNFTTPNSTQKLYTSTDFGVSWSFVLDVSTVSTHSSHVPIECHDLKYINGWMVTGCHFDNTNKVTFVRFQPSNPAGTITFLNAILPTTGSTQLCETVFWWDPANAKFIFGMRTQTYPPNASTPTSLGFMADDFSGSITKFAAPRNTPYSPCAIVIDNNGDIVFSVVDRYTDGALRTWRGTKAAFYAQDVSSFVETVWGTVLTTPSTPGAASTENGVEAMTVTPKGILVGFSQTRANDNSDCFTMRLPTARLARQFTAQDVYDSTGGLSAP